MPRTARTKSKSGIYHIMLRGANRQVIFHDEEDNARFIETLKRYKNNCKIKVYGWCLMGNHVHLLIGEGDEEISATIKRIGVSYAGFYNWKYKTTGHLFQDRFKSENIDCDGYLMTVLRYIHQNPVKAGLVEKPSEWNWSSCRVYYGEKCYPPGLLDNELVFGETFESKERAMKEFIIYNEQECTDICLEDVVKVRLTDKDAADEIKKLIQGYEFAEVKSLPKDKREMIFKKIKEIEGISLRQAARILGVSHVLIFGS